MRDIGIGIAAEHLPHVFKMFSQVAPALKRSQEGLGIGLALARGPVELHNGRVEAQTPGPCKGSEFIVSLPVAEPPAGIVGGHWRLEVLAFILRQSESPPQRATPYE